MKLLSVQLLEKKREKWAPELRAHVDRWLSSVPHPFEAFRHRPNADQVFDMFMSAKFGPGDPLSAGSDIFAFEYILDELCQAVQDTRDKILNATVIDPTTEDIGIMTSRNCSTQLPHPGHDALTACWHSP